MARKHVSAMVLYKRPVYICNLCCDFPLLMDVNEWMNCECSDEGAYTPNIRNSSTHSHTSEGENRTRNRSENCKCQRTFKVQTHRTEFDNATRFF